MQAREGQVSQSHMPREVGTIWSKAGLNDDTPFPLDVHFFSFQGMRAPQRLGQAAPEGEGPIQVTHPPGVPQIPTQQLRFIIFYRLAVVFCHIQTLVNVTRDGLNFCPQLLFNTLQVETIVIGDQVDG